PDLPAPATPVPLQVPGLVIGVSPPGTFPVDVSPRTPPPATIPSGPEVILPTAPPSETRPARLFEFRPMVGVSEEYTDNFNRFQLNQPCRKSTSNQRSGRGGYSLGTLETKEHYRRSGFTAQTGTTQSNTLGLSASKSLGRIHIVTAGYEYLTSDTTLGTAAV